MKTFKHKQSTYNYHDFMKYPADSIVLLDKKCWTGINCDMFAIKYHHLNSSFSDIVIHTSKGRITTKYDPIMDLDNEFNEDLKKLIDSPE